MQKAPILLLFLCFLQPNEIMAQLQMVEKAIDQGLIHIYDHAIFMGGGAAAFDADADGDLDLYVVGGNLGDGLFINDGHGAFTNFADSFGITSLTDALMTTSVVTADIDNDGRREIFVGTFGKSGTLFEFEPNLLLQYNTQSGKYENVAAQSQISSSSFCLGGHFFDANLDGFLDLYVLNYVEEVGFLKDTNETIIGFDHDCGINRLYLNNQDGTFTDVTEDYGLDSEGCTLAATSSDLDQDGDPDLIIANDFGKWLQPNQIFQNNYPLNEFSDISSSSMTDAQMYAMGIAVADFDEDQDQDFYVTNIADNHLFENQDDGTFINIAMELEVDDSFTDDFLYTTGWGCFFTDLNNDAFLDLFVANGYVQSGVDVDGEFQFDKLYQGQGKDGFMDVSEESGVHYPGSSRGALYGDFNLDGKQDVVTITNDFIIPDEENSIRYYENNSVNANWIGLILEGTASNRDAFGATIKLFANGRVFLRETAGGSSHASQNSSWVHFGLGSIETIDSVIIRWPSGIEQFIQSPGINQYHDILESSVTSIAPTRHHNAMSIYPNPVKDRLRIDFYNGFASAQLQDLSGRIIKSWRGIEPGAHIGVENISSGYYFLIVEQSTILTIFPIIII